MTLEIWLAFVVANSILTIIPGPSVLLVISQALTRGMSAALMCILGDIIGGVVLMLLSLIGVGAILATSATLFIIFKWLGVIYLFYLGCYQIINARVNSPQNENVNKKYRAINSFKIGFFVSLLNPKAILFYMAFLPQFLNPENDHFLQFLILIVTSSILIGVILTCYAFIAARTRKAFNNIKFKKYFDYSGGSFLIGSSLLLASSTK